jgi:hypothetical protein
VTYQAPRLLTPGLTPRQTDRLREHLIRLTASGAAVPVYIDADRLAGRWMLSPHAADHQPARCTVATIKADYPAMAIELVAYIAGFAQGIRIGRTFAPAPASRAKRWISEEYRQLTEPGRRDAARYIRKLLKIERHRDVKPHAAPAAVEAASARAWVRKAGQTARAAQRA